MGRTFVLEKGADPNNPDVIDLVIEDYNFTLTTGDTDYIAQKIENILYFFLGEWWLFPEEGIPYYESILVKNPDLNLIQSIFSNAILSIEEVETIEKLDLTYTNSNRLLEVDFTVISTSGDTITGNV